MVIIGGITRLTHSGLSMVAWKPVTGILPPLNETQWQEEFSNYKTSPEFKIKNFDFDLQDFKSIFWWEYIHRFLARLIAYTFIIPFLYFLFTKKLSNRLLVKKLIIIFLLGAFQGFIGWFMVASGLKVDPEVSHYWLAFHLISALFLISYILWTAMSILFREKISEISDGRTLRRLLNTLLVFLGIQIFYGALVAGLKAGLFYPTFPKMGTEWIPGSIPGAFSVYGIWALLEDPVTVQFLHRTLAYIVALIIVYVLYKVRKLALSVHQKNVCIALGVLLVIQFTLGIYTILYSVPVVLGVLHQLGAALLLAAVIIGIFFFRRGHSS